MLKQLSIPEILNKVQTKNGRKIYYLNGLYIKDDNDFFKEVILKLPCNPPLSGKINWNALSDSLFFGLIYSKHNNIFVIWHNFSGPYNISYPIIEEVFSDLSHLISTESHGEKTFELLLTTEKFTEYL